MSYRTILAELTTEGSVEVTLPVARELGGRFGAAVVGMHVLPVPYLPSAWEGGASVYLAPELLESQRATARAARDRVEAKFRSLVRAEDGAEWREAEGEAELLLTQAAHTVDLVVAARGPGSSAVAEALIAGAGVPVLVVGEAPVTGLGRTVLVGWNGGREAARAVHQALPFLAGAGRVVLCAVGQAAESSLAAAATMLGRHGAAVEPLAMAEPDGSAGRVLAEQAKALGADLLVVGAYGRSRVRELVFGGATRHLLDRAPVPVLFGT